MTLQHCRFEPRRGQAMVEFALIVPIFVLLLVGLFDAGRAVYAFNTVNNAAREAGRVAIVDQTLTHVQAEGVAQGSGLGLEASDISIMYRNPADTGSCPNSPPAIGCLAVITVTYDYTAAFPVVGQLLGVSAVSGRTTFPIEATCVEPAQAQCPKGS